MMVDGQGGLHRVVWWDCEDVAGSDLELNHGVCGVMTWVVGYTGCRIDKEAASHDIVIHGRAGDEAVEGGEQRNKCDWSQSRFS